MLVAAGMGLAGTSGASALSVNGAAIGDIATATDHVTQVQWGHGCPWPPPKLPHSSWPPPKLPQRWGSFGRW